MLFLGLLFELLFLFIDIGYNILMQSYPAIKSIRQGFYYVFIFAGIFFIMFSGGYLTSVYAKRHRAAHAATAAIIACAIALYATNDGYNLTIMSAMFVIVSIAFSLYGNRVFIKTITKDTLA